MNEVESFLNSLNIKKNDVLVVAVSYGPDSMFLLDLLKNKYTSNKIICAHVHHNHRKESDAEARLLKEYCVKNKLTFEFMKIKKYDNGNFSEEEARKKRYEFFDTLMTKYNSKYLFTAHHGDDLSETILMRIVRGANVSGYVGIRKESDRAGYKIIRPLLYLTKENIEKYCNMNKIPYAVDASNESSLYTRNRYRNVILKSLKEENKNVHKKFLQFSEELEEYDNYINKVVDEHYLKVVDKGVINISKINGLEDLIKRKIIERYLLEEYKDDIKSVNHNHVLKIKNVIDRNKPNCKVSMPLGKTIVKSYKSLYFDNEPMYNSYCYRFDGFIKLPNGYVIKRIDDLKDTSNFVAAFNSNDISLPLYVRNKKNGDKMSVLNLNGEKKIKDIFIDEKVCITRRDKYPVLVDSDDRILWLPGLKKSKYDKSKKGNYDIILEYYKEEN